MTPRGIRGRNPGNIRHGSDWQGLAAEQPDPSFCTFVSPEYGIRAIARILQNYQDKHGLRTPTAIISRWAPPNENDTTAYVDSVCSACGWPVDAALDMHRWSDLRPMVLAIIRHENGQQPYPDDVIDAGLRLAGVEMETV